jgi:benzoyl-CoA reductase subunit D
MSEPCTILCAGIDVGSSRSRPWSSRTRHRRPALLARHQRTAARRDPLRGRRGAYDGGAARAAGCTRDSTRLRRDDRRGRERPFRTGPLLRHDDPCARRALPRPQARAVIDIGALHARAVLMDERGKVLGYRMTSQCASGSGQFLENICRYLGVTIDEIGPLSLQADKPEAVQLDLRGARRDRRDQHGLARHLDPEHPEGHPPLDGGSLRQALASAGRRDRATCSSRAASPPTSACWPRCASSKAAPLTLRAHRLSVHAGAIGAALWGGVPRAQARASSAWALTPGRRSERRAGRADRPDGFAGARDRRRRRHRRRDRGPLARAAGARVVSRRPQRTD